MIKLKIKNLKQVNLLNQTFLLPLIFGLIASIYLTIYWRVEQDFNQWFLELLLYASILWHLYQKRNDLEFVSRFPANFVGCCLIIIPYINARFSVQEISISWYFLPLISATGLALLASGFRRIKQFRRELAIIIIFPLTLISVKLLGTLIQITVISAKLTSFLLWYLGFDSITQGSLVTVNNGSIDILSECTAIPLLIFLLKFSFILAILFPSMLKNIYLPFILSVVISVIFSTIRLVIIALVVKDKLAFNYWHGSQGGDIFTLLSFLCFGTVILFLSPAQIPSLLTKKAIPHKSRSASWLSVLTGLGLIVILFYFWISPSAGLIQITAYRFPSQISLPGWQFVDSKSLLLPSQQLAKENNRFQPNTNVQADKGRNILSGQIYHYQKAGQSLTVNFYYIPSSLGDIQAYYEQFSDLPNLPKLIKPVEKVNSQGYNFRFSDSLNHYLTACINSQGKSTVTISQFAAHFYRPYLNPSQWLNILNGKQTLRDRRCIWGQLSLAKADASNTELETAWQALLSYWHSNFPRLKL